MIRSLINRFKKWIAGNPTPAAQMPTMVTVYRFTPTDGGIASVLGEPKELMQKKEKIRQVLNGEKMVYFSSYKNPIR